MVLKYLKIKNFVFTQLLLCVADKRMSSCWMHVEAGPGGQPRCSHEMGHGSRATCCCSMGRAWGSQCELCPEEGSQEMEALCPTGSGFRPNNRTVSPTQCLSRHLEPRLGLASVKL